MTTRPNEYSSTSVEIPTDQIPPFPYELQDAIRKNRLILFLGAGISCAAGAKDWNRITELIIDDYKNRNLINNGELGQLSSEHYYTKLEFLKRRDSDLFQRRFSELLDIKEQAVIRKYGSLVRKLMKLKPVSIVTTNIDDLMQKSKIFDDDKYYYKDKCNPQKIHSFCVFCLHGNISNNIFVLSEKSRYYNNTDFRFFLDNLFGSFCILFLGYSLDRRDVLEGCHVNTASLGDSEFYHHALVPSDQSFPRYELEMSYKIKLHRYRNDSALDHGNFAKTVDNWVLNVAPGIEISSPTEFPDVPRN